MKVKIIQPIKYSGNRHIPGTILELPDDKALPLIKDKIVEVYEEPSEDIQEATTNNDAIDAVPYAIGNPELKPKSKKFKKGE